MEEDRRRMAEPAWGGKGAEGRGAEESEGTEGSEGVSKAAQWNLGH